MEAADRVISDGEQMVVLNFALTLFNGEIIGEHHRLATARSFIRTKVNMSHSQRLRMSLSHVGLVFRNTDLFVKQTSEVLIS